MSRRKKDIMVREIDEQTVRTMAHIIGVSSAAAKALAEAERRRKLGQAVAFYQTTDGVLLVGPPMTTPDYP